MNIFIRSNNDCVSVLTNNICLMPKSGFQSLFNVLTQISPFDATFGWKIFVRKNAFGGVDGKSLPNTNFTRKAPPEYGVPAKKKKRKLLMYFLFFFKIFILTS